MISQFSGQKTGGCLDSLCVFPTCAIVARAPLNFSLSAIAHFMSININGDSHCTIFFQIINYLEQNLVNKLKNSWDDSQVSSWSDQLRGGLGSSWTTVPVAVWEGFAWKMRRPWFDGLKNCYSKLIGWSNPLQQPLNDVEFYW